LSAISPTSTAARSRDHPRRHCGVSCRCGKTVNTKPPARPPAPSGIPVQERWRLVREGRVDEAVDLALAFTPFPATVCGYLCPQSLHDACTKGGGPHGAGGRDPNWAGPASTPGCRAAAHFRQTHRRGRRRSCRHLHGLAAAAHGHEAVVFDNRGRWAARSHRSIPSSRIPDDVSGERAGPGSQGHPHVHLQQRSEPVYGEQ
jgi:hypothetical protein